MNRYMTPYFDARINKPQNDHRFHPIYCDIVEYDDR